jgi:hypothetical protein
VSQNPFCEAEHVGDEMVCPLCELTWDLLDPNPPACQFDTNGPQSLVSPPAPVSK